MSFLFALAVGWFNTTTQADGSVMIYGELICIVCTVYTPTVLWDGNLPSTSGCHSHHYERFDL